MTEAKSDEISKLTEALSTAYEEIVALYDMGALLVNSLHSQETMLEGFLDKVKQCVPCDQGVLCIWFGEQLRYQSAWGGVQHLPDLNRQAILRHLRAHCRTPVTLNRLREIASQAAPSATHTGQLRLTTAVFLQSWLPDTPENAICLPVGTSGSDRLDGILLLLNHQGAACMEDFTAGDQRLLVTLSNQMALALETSLASERFAKQQRWERELEIASAIQSGLLQQQAPVIPGVIIAGTSRPAHEVGGDYFDYFPHPQSDNFGLVVGDVTGKGVPAALLMAMARTAFRTLDTALQDPGQILSRLNAILFEDFNVSDSYMTACYATIDLAKRELHYANAAHHPPLHWRHREQQFAHLHAPGQMIGLLRDSHYPTMTYRFEPGDRLFFFTDGLLDLRNQDGEFFGQDRLEAAIVKHLASGPQGILDGVYAELDEFGLHRQLIDDMTFVVLQIT